MATIRIERTSEYNNRLREYSVYIDDQKAGTIGNGQAKDFEVPTGTHTVYAKIDWCSSPVVKFNSDSDKVKTFKVGGFKNGNWLMPLAIGIIVLSYILKSVWGSYYFFYLVIPPFLLLIYYLTLGRKKYLSIKELN